MLSIRQHDEDPAFDSRCVALRVVQGVGPPQLVEADHLFDCLEDLKEEVRSPLYLPFALSVYAVHACRDSLTAIHWCVSSASTTTSDGLFGKTYGLGNGTPIDRNRVVKESRSIGIALSNAAFVTSTLNGVESLWQYLEAMAEEISPSAKTEQVVQSTNNLLEAIRFLRQEVKCMRETVRYGEVSIRNHASLISAHLSHRDSETNIETAVASRDLAAAATEDSSAMKSIAILTMFFLPGTFFAALFSMPALGWDQPRHFVLYWAFTIPATILTFAIWAALTQRSVVLGWVKMVWLNWPWGFWRGKRGEEEDEEKGKKAV
ncbi:hypothetical protein B0H65DRAFT_437459 [Neurospora tetraspora]|uniref:Uncharacterized protein n=1 Tax=Neurospora tetraspora TaxID=94610 RepID=A0AAE0IZY7_9PEZI|nr:hypothetical protein B0H65DRAFT_437459 [Neurospora tetraspora]